jgi:membrane protein implicated in regulation of membrane protease activity
MDAYQFTLIVAFALGMAELLMPGAFIFLGMAIGAVAVAMIQWVASDFSINRDLMVFAVVATAAFLVLRRIFARISDQTTAENDVNQY